MKIVAEHLVRLPIFKGHSETKLYKVLETSTKNTQFYREVWNKGNVHYEMVDKDLFYEQNDKFSLED
jgi:hypothetical protein